MGVVADGLIGFAVADALGVPVEFCGRTYLEKNPVSNMLEFGTHNVPKGTWSDDTSMTIATIDSIIQKNNIDINDIMIKFVDWYKNANYTATGELFDIGRTTQKAITKYLYFNVPANKCGGLNINDNGNGSLMRMFPIAIYLFYNKLSIDTELNIINNVSSITHGHEISRLGCLIYSNYIKLLLSGYDKESAFKMLSLFPYEKYYSDESIAVYNRILSGNLLKLSVNEIKSSGYIVDTLEASIWCTLKCNNYEDSVIKAINLGNDTDTIGAITGSINGIIYHVDTIPKQWINNLKRKEYLYELASNFEDKIIHIDHLEKIFR